MNKMEVKSFQDAVKLQKARDVFLTKGHIISLSVHIYRMTVGMMEGSASVKANSSTLSFF